MICISIIFLFNCSIWCSGNPGSSMWPIEHAVEFNLEEFYCMIWSIDLDLVYTIFNWEISLASYSD